MWSVIFSCLTSSMSCAILSQAGLLEVPMTYLGSLGYFLGVAERSLPKQANANGRSRVCSLLILVPYPKHLHFTSLTLTIEY
jgi:hypothetical protein